MVEAAAGQIVVAETGNRRQEITDADVTQCIKDIAQWLKEKAPGHHAEKMEPRVG